MGSSRAISLQHAPLSALSHQTNLSVGCYCADEARGHRSVLKALLRARGADVEA